MANWDAAWQRIVLHGGAALIPAEAPVSRQTHSVSILTCRAKANCTEAWSIVLGRWCRGGHPTRPLTNFRPLNTRKRQLTLPINYSFTKTASFYTQLRTNCF